MKLFLAAVLALALAAPAAAQQPQVTGLEILHAGIYAIEPGQETRDDKGVLVGPVKSAKLAVSTTRVPAKLGASFGIEYRLIGAPAGAKVTVKEGVRYPAPGAHPASTGQLVAFDSSDTTLAINGSNTSLYTIEEPWEVLPGTWVFEIWLGDRKLGEQTFTLVAE